MSGTVGTYTMAFPVRRPHQTFADLSLEAAEALHAQLEDLGYLPAGVVRFEIVARVDVALLDEGPDDPRPWESRDGYGGEMFDPYQLTRWAA